MNNEYFKPINAYLCDIDANMFLRFKISMRQYGAQRRFEWAMYALQNLQSLKQ